jgi:hypothetical protein
MGWSISCFLWFSKRVFLMEMLLDATFPVTFPSISDTYSIVVTVPVVYFGTWSIINKNRKNDTPQKRMPMTEQCKKCSTFKIMDLSAK